MITIRTSTRGIPFLSCMSMGHRQISATTKRAPKASNSQSNEGRYFWKLIVLHNPKTEHSKEWDGLKSFVLLSSDWLVDWLIHWLIPLLTGCLRASLIFFTDWLTDWRYFQSAKRQRRNVTTWLNFVDCTEIKAFVELNVSSTIRAGAQNLLMVGNLMFFNIKLPLNCERWFCFILNYFPVCL